MVLFSMLALLGQKEAQRKKGEVMGVGKKRKRQNFSYKGWARTWSKCPFCKEEIWNPIRFRHIEVNHSAEMERDFTISEMEE